MDCGTTEELQVAYLVWKAKELSSYCITVETSSASIWLDFAHLAKSFQLVIENVLGNDIIRTDQLNITKPRPPEVTTFEKLKVHRHYLIQPSHHNMVPAADHR